MSRPPLNLTVCSVLEIERRATIEADFVVSLLDPRYRIPLAVRSLNNDRRLCLRFHDVIVESSAQLVAPQYKDMERLIGFGKKILERGANKKLLIHCYAGVSRSTAAAIIILSLMTPSDPRSAVKRLLEIVPNAWPNIRMIRLGDELLKQGGHLTEAVSAIFETTYQQHPEFARLMSARQF
jgi:predicted protein tyrosine phosphatase